MAEIRRKLEDMEVQELCDETLLSLAQALNVMFSCTTLKIEKSYRKVLWNIVS